MRKVRRKSGNPDLGQVARAVRAARVTDDADSARDFRRRLVADFCKLLGDQLPTGGTPAKPDLPELAPRLRQTLDCLLAGDSEKQIAVRLGISPHTVHQYVKGLHKRLGVSSRGELLARWVRA